jgi:hypothetical protein
MPGGIEAKGLGLHVLDVSGQLLVYTGKASSQADHEARQR